MFKNILITTDGADLAAKAVEQGILFAKEIGAKITAVVVHRAISIPLARAERTDEDTPIEYKKYAEAHARKCSVPASAAAKVDRCRLRDASRRARTGLSGGH